MNRIDDKTEVLIGDIRNLLREYCAFLQCWYGKFGELDGEESSQGLVKEIMSRFFSNLVCLENHLNTKDSLSAALMGRYNHELLIDFYYVIDPGGELDKVANFFNYNSSKLKPWWSTRKISEKRRFVPPWVASNESLNKLYRKLSDLAHPNIVSLRINRRGSEHEYFIIRDVITLCIFEISVGFNHQSFRNLFLNIEWDEIVDGLNTFQYRAVELGLK